MLPLCVRTLLPLLAVPAMLALPASGLATQDAQGQDVSIVAGVGYVLPFDIHHGRIHANGTLLTTYREAVPGTAEPWVSGRLALVNGRHHVTVRARFGQAGTTGHYEGGSAPESIGRELSWVGLDAVGGFGLFAGERTSFALRAGLSATRWRLETGRMPSAYRDLMAPGTDGVIAGTDRTWGGLHLLAGAEARHALGSRVHLTAAVEWRTAGINRAAFESGDAEDLRRGTAGTTPALRYAQSDGAGGLALLAGVKLRVGTRGRPDAAALAVAAVAAHSAASPSKAAHGPDAAVEAALAAGDTARAIELLERRIAEDGRDAAAHGVLGVLLAGRAGAVPGRFTDRRRAQALLEEALRLDPGNPRYLLAMGIVLEKAGLTIDAARVVGRALSAAIRRPDALNRDELAELFYRRGRAVESMVMDFEGLRMLPMITDPVLNTVDCIQWGSFCMNWMNPQRFFAAMAELPDATDLREDTRSRMMDEFRRALELVPSHEGARRAVLAAHARLRDWEAVRREAEEYVAVSPEQPWARVFLGMATYLAGDPARGAELMEDAVAALPTAEQAIFDNLRPVLITADEEAWDKLGPEARRSFASAYWAKGDPLYLTPWNEYRAEHQARVALAELLFGEPMMDLRGWETDRGLILIRYGLPAAEWQVVRNNQRILTGLRAAYAQCLIENGFDESACGEIPPEPDVGGRWIFWNYDPAEPSFIFEKMLGRARVRHMFHSASLEYATQTKKHTPTRFEPPFRREALPHQVAVFRARDRDAYEAEIYAQAPSAFRTAPGGSRGGLFIFAGAEHAPVAQREVVPDRDGHLDATVRLQPGLFSYSLEALSGDTLAAIGRGNLEVGAYGPGILRLSDLLLVSEVEQKGDVVWTHHDLAYTPLRCIAAPADGRLGMIFEIHGLVEQDGLVRYEIEIRMGEERSGGALRLLRLLGRLLGRESDEGAVRYEREVEVRGDRVVDWLELELPAESRREGRLSVTVRDRTVDASATAYRDLGARPCGG